MQLFDVLNSQLFKPLTGRYRGMFAELLMLIWDHCRTSTDYGMGKSEMIRLAEDFLDGADFEVSELESGEEAEEPLPSRDLHSRAVWSVARLRMEHSLQGQLALNGSVLDLSGGTGYIEADRGRSFPADYLWTQCVWNDCSLMLSIATIPFGKLRFTGCICAIVLNGQAYRIATYRGVKIQNWSARGALLSQGKYRLEVQLLEQKAQTLRAPSGGDMSRTVRESLCAKVRYRFWRDGELLLDHTDAHAGFEYAKN